MKLKLPVFRMNQSLFKYKLKEKSYSCFEAWDEREVISCKNGLHLTEDCYCLKWQ